MSRFIDYEPMHVDEIDYNKCKCESKKDCRCFEKEDGVIKGK